MCPRGSSKSLGGTESIMSTSVAEKEQMIREFEDLFTNRALPIFCTQIQHMYARAKENNKYHYNLLKEFQDELRKTASWKEEDKNDKYMALATARMDVDIRLLFRNILDLQEGVLKSQGYKLAHARPDMKTFVHNVYLNIARELFMNPFIMYDDVDTRQSQQNIEDLKRIVKRSIKLCFCAIKADIDEVVEEGANEGANECGANECGANEGGANELIDHVESVSSDFSDDEDIPEKIQEAKPASPTSTTHQHFFANTEIQPASSEDGDREIVVNEIESNQRRYIKDETCLAEESAPSKAMTNRKVVGRSRRHKVIKKCLVRRHKVPLIKSGGFESGAEED